MAKRSRKPAASLLCKGGQHGSGNGAAGSKRRTVHVDGRSKRVPDPVGGVRDSDALDAVPGAALTRVSGRGCAAAGCERRPVPSHVGQVPTLTSDYIEEIADAARNIIKACDLASECNGTRAMACAVLWTFDMEHLRLRVARSELGRMIGVSAADDEAAALIGAAIQETAATDRSGQERTRSTASTGTNPASHGGRCRKECNGC